MPTPRLRIDTGAHRGREVELTRSLVIGRAASCDVVLADDSCSRMHARVTPDGGGAKVEDLGSTNGTLVNGEKVGVGFIGDGDRITIGDTTLTFRKSGFDGGATVILSTSVRDDAIVRKEVEVEADAEVAGKKADAATLAALVNAQQALLEATRGVPEQSVVARALLTVIGGLLKTDRGALFVFQDGASGAREATLVAIPDLQIDADRPWITRALAKRKALFLEDRRRGKNPLFGLVVPWFDRAAPQFLLYLDRRKVELTPADLALVVPLLRAAGALLPSTQLCERMRAELQEHRVRIEGERRIVGVSAAHQSLLAAVKKAAPTEQGVLLIGETGTGKELLARQAHDLSPRSQGPFVTVNCSATAEHMLELEILGGRFTHAGRSEERIGAVERAAGGTLFLDEVDALDLATQARLASVLLSKKVTRAGGRETPVDVRLIAASDRDLSALAQRGSFRDELLALVAMNTVRVPPLRERTDDIVLLADHFLKRHASRMNRSARRLHPDALRALLAYAWPGNVRELSNVIERAVVLSKEEEITADLLPFSGSAALREEELSMDFAEKQAIIRALAYCEGKKGHASRVLGISWPTLNKKIHDYGITL